MKAALYARYSTDRQNESSIADQVRVCTEYAQQHSLQIVEQFSDEGISGAAVGNRPGVLKLQEAALARRFDVLLVTDLSRLSRSNGDLSKMIDRFVSRGIRIVGVQDGYDSARRGHKLQAGLSGIIGEAFREMVKDRTYAALETRAKTRRPTGGRAYGYIAASRSASGEMEVNEQEAQIVREIFQRYADGESCFAIAADLNARRVPSPGSSWNRTKRRAKGWMGSAIRGMLRNPLYKGEVIWNASEWRKDPDSGKRVRVQRPQSEWVRYRNDDLQIVAPALWERAQRETRKVLDDHSRGRMKTPYLLSGILMCDVCGSNFIMADDRAYACSSFVNGRACTNTIRVRRDHAEAKLIGPIQDELLRPDRVQRMASELQRRYNERMSADLHRAEQLPKELQEIEARIARLRARLRRGDDPDMTADEIQAAIDRAEAKRDELASTRPDAKQQAKILALLPKAAEEYRRQIAAGLNGHVREALKARALLRELFGGKVRMIPGLDGSLWAEFGLHTRALLRGADGFGSGGRI
jgi:site-specific DNA recombinase